MNKEAASSHSPWPHIQQLHEVLASQKVAEIGDEVGPESLFLPPVQSYSCARCVKSRDPLVFISVVRLPQLTC